jgi:NTP pyrophosphatase (non-canonical NTP hydrolase)
MLKLLEWLAFGGSLCSVYLYGRSRIYGPYAGLGVSILFVTFGLASGIYAAAVSNVVFFYLHMRNLLRAKREDVGIMKKEVAAAMAVIVSRAHGIAVESGWWAEYATIPQEYRKYFIATKLCLIHSEVSEGMEGQRKNKMDDHLPHRSMLEVELADAIIRIADLAGGLGLDLAGAVAEKMEYNAIRPDHKPEHRSESEFGKKF